MSDGYGGDATVQSETRLSDSWLSEIGKAEKLVKDWHDRCDKIQKLYARQEVRDKMRRRFAMLWANCEVLKPATYARQPQPAVAQRFKRRDPLAKETAEILQAALTTATDLYADDQINRSIRNDYLLYGRGTGRLRYEATIAPAEEGQPETVDAERAPLDFVHRKDFLHGSARTWEELCAGGWVAFRAWLDKDGWKQRFPEAEFIPAKQNKIGIAAEQEATKAPVWEIWDAAGREVLWAAPGHANLLDFGPPHLSFEDFFPCPRPAYGTLTTETLIPTPDYAYYQDQAEEIDELTGRIGKLQDQLKLVGFYPGGAEGSAQIERALDPAVENVMIPVDSFAAFAEKGGSAQIIWLPIKDVAAVIQSCIELRRQLIEDVYQITGISDIVRGQTDPNETLGAQKLKGQFSSVRVQDRQLTMAYFCRDTQRLRAEIMAENFQPKTLMEMSGSQLPVMAPPPQMGMPQMPPLGPQMPGQPGQMPMRPPPPPVTFSDVMRVLRSNRLRDFVVDVETDSTIAPDEQAEREEWNGLLTAVAAFLREALPVVQGAPPMLQFVGELLSATVRKFRVGRGVEDVLEKALSELEQAAAQPQQQAQPDPSIAAKAQADKAASDARLAETGATHQATMAEIAANTELKRIELQLAVKRLEQTSLDLQAKAELERQSHRHSLEQMREQAKARRKAGDQRQAAA